MSMDLYPTLLDAAGVRRSDGQIEDGRSTLPMILGGIGLIAYAYKRQSVQGAV